MTNMQRRLRALEQSAQWRRPPTPLQQIEEGAMRQVSDEDLEVMMIMATDREGGIVRPISARESAMLAAHNATLETEARRMGFQSFAQAERIWRQR